MMEGLAKIQHKTPLQPTLKKHIAYYYFLKETQPITPTEFWHYPHYYTIYEIVLLSYFRSLWLSVSF